MSNDNSANGFLAFLVGGLLGAGAALLLAPRTGRETRENLKEYAKTVEDIVKEKAENAKEIANEEVKKFSIKAKEAFEEGKATFDKEMNKTDQSENT